jgi:hypothetical protein
MTPKPGSVTWTMLHWEVPPVPYSPRCPKCGAHLGTSELWCHWCWTCLDDSQLLTRG